MELSRSLALTVETALAHKSWWLWCLRVWVYVLGLSLFYSLYFYIGIACIRAFLSHRPANLDLDYRNNKDILFQNLIPYSKIFYLNDFLKWCLKSFSYKFYSPFWFWMQSRAIYWIKLHSLWGKFGFARASSLEEGQIHGESWFCLKRTRWIISWVVQIGNCEGEGCPVWFDFEGFVEGNFIFLRLASFLDRVDWRTRRQFSIRGKEV